MVEYICGSGLLTCGGRPCPPSAPGRRLPEPRFHPSLSAAGRWKLICDFESTPLFSSPIISAKNPKDCCELNHPAGPAESQTIQSGAAGGRADSCLLICDFESTPLFSSPIISAKNPKDCCELNHPAGPAESQTIQSGAAGGRADSCLLLIPHNRNRHRPGGAHFSVHHNHPHLAHSLVEVDCLVGLDGQRVG